MRFCLAVPTYWTHPGGVGKEEVIYDHPTPLDAPGTLARFLDSLRDLSGPQMQVVIVAAAVAETLAEAVEERLCSILASLPLSCQPLLFSYSHLKKLHSFCRGRGCGDFCGLLSLSGYASIRNLTLVLANLLTAEVLVSLDDDEMLVQSDYLARIEEDYTMLAKDYEKFGLGGLYENPDGGILAAEPTDPWSFWWPKIRWMNQAWSELAAPDANLRLTPLALGGNMVLGAPLYRYLPFDPAVVRGEDVDYVINARMFQVPFFLDHKLRVLHDPPAKPHPRWLRLRQDLNRFWYTRQKLLSQESPPSMALVAPEELMPYPGNFLTEDLELRAYRAHTALALEYLEAGEEEDARQTLLNLAVMQTPPPARSVFQTYLDVVLHWRRLQSWLAAPEVREAALAAIWGQV
ncbi:hypothetical protein [Desulfobacca acetoxidans]